SRRRHTRCLSDWSSDVCSSDLPSAEQSWLLQLAGWMHRHAPAVLAFNAACALLIIAPTTAVVLLLLRRRFTFARVSGPLVLSGRSEERRVGKECRSVCAEDTDE